MADSKNLVLKLLISAKDEASATLGKLFTFLNDGTNVVAGKLRDAFSNLFGGGIDSAAAFEQTMNAVAAKGSYTAEEMKKLAAAADRIGASFGVNSLEAAKGMEVLAAAGLKSKDVISTLPPVMALARLEGISLDIAATKLADSLSVMGLGFEHAGRMADVLAQGANITLSSASQLADALAIAGGAAKDYGLDLEQTVALLDLLHKNGIKGAEAGTALRGILLQLLDPTSQASQAIAELGGNSRNFTSVLEALKPQTEKTNQALLAFGTESSTAIRVLRTEGVAGAAEFTSQIRNAAGAAQDASETMSGGLNAALQALAAAWDSLKKNLLAPLLEPLAQQARRLADDLNGVAQSEGVQKLGALIAAAAGTALTWLRKAADEGVSYLESKLGGLSFGDIVSKVEAAKASLVALVGAGLDAISAKLRETAANMVQTSTQLVIDLKTGLSGLLEGIASLPVIWGEAADRLKTSVEELRQGLPELQKVATEAGTEGAKAQDEFQAALGRTKQAIDDLQTGTTEFQRVAREQARQLGMSEAEYQNYLEQHGVQLQKLLPVELKRLRATTDTQAALLAQNRQQKDNAQGAKTLQQIIDALVATYQREENELRNSAQVLATVADSRERVARAALQMAQASGDQQAVDSAQANLDQTLIDGGYRRAAAAQQVADADQLKANQTALAAVADGQYTLSEMETQNALEERAGASQGAADASYAEAEANEASIKAAQKAAQAQKEQADSGGAFAAVLASQIQYWRDNTAALSDATRALFEYKAGFSSVDPRLGRQVFGGISEEAQKAGAEIQRLTQHSADMQYHMLMATNDIGRLFASISYAGAEAQKSYYEQKLAAEQLEAKLKQIGETGGKSFASVNAALGFVNDTTQTAIDSFSLLNEQDLAQLRAAMDDANQKLKDMQDEAQSARDRIAELNAEIAAEKGDDSTAARLKLELEQRQALAEVEAKLAEARAANSRELIALYEQEKQKLLELYALKEKNLESDQKQAKTAATGGGATPASPAPSGGGARGVSGAGGGGGGGITVNVNAASAQVLDPKFVDALARQLQPVLASIQRRLN